MTGSSSSSALLAVLGTVLAIDDDTVSAGGGQTLAPPPRLMLGLLRRDALRQNESVGVLISLALLAAARVSPLQTTPAAASFPPPVVAPVPVGQPAEADWSEHLSGETRAGACEAGAGASAAQIGRSGPRTRSRRYLMTCGQSGVGGRSVRRSA